MSKRDKLRRKLRNNPKSATLQEVKTLLGYYNFNLDRVVGSHHVFRFDDGNSIMNLIIPVHGRKVKSQYVKRAIEIIDQMFPTEDEND